MVFHFFPSALDHGVVLWDQVGQTSSHPKDSSPQGMAMMSEVYILTMDHIICISWT